MAKKAGISVGKSVVDDSVHSVTEFLHKGKTDELGEFASKSRTTQPRSNRRATPAPKFWKHIVNAAECHTGGSLIISISVENCSDHYKSDLLLSSDDLNSCNFHKKLAKCLVKETSVVYIEVNKTTIRGSARLLSILKDVKQLFDSRIWVVLITGEKPLSDDVSKLVDFSLSDKFLESSLPPPSKKRKVNDNDVEPKQFLSIDKLQERLEASENDRQLLKISLEEKNNTEFNLVCINKSLSKDLDELKSTIEVKNSYIKQLVDKLKDSKVEITSLSIKNKGLEEKLSKLKTENDGLKKPVSSKTVPPTLTSSTKTGPETQDISERCTSRKDISSLDVKISEQLKIKVLEMEVQ